MKTTACSQSGFFVAIIIAQVKCPGQIQGEMFLSFKEHAWLGLPAAAIVLPVMRANVNRFEITAAHFLVDFKDGPLNGVDLIFIEQLFV